MLAASSSISAAFNLQPPHRLSEEPLKATRTREWLVESQFAATMSNGTNEPLPGLLDNPQFTNDLPWNNLSIAPLRNPAPPQQRNANAPSPLEPGNASAVGPSGRSRSGSSQGLRRDGSRRPPNITPSDVLQARESRKPHLAISELVDDNDDASSSSGQLPSFVSLSVVEKSPTQTPQLLHQTSLAPAHKRPRLESDSEHASHDLGRQLPRPAQREQAVHRLAPLLPTMVTGLHEPPPSAALLPSMDPDRRPGIARANTTSKIQVKDILMDPDSRSPSPIRHPFQSNEHDPALSHPHRPLIRSSTETFSGSDTRTSKTPLTSTIQTKDGKTRRARRKWTDDETRDLLQGVRTHGAGKWKQILQDKSYTFHERSAVDLKDRYRVCAKDENILATHGGGGGGGGIPSPPSTTGAPVSPTASDTPSAQNPPMQPSSASRAGSPVGATGAHKARRKRRAWTSEEDDALLQGVAKHGFQWTAIHDDQSLGLGHRRATDLRDRIRNKYPEGYRQAETKPLRAEIKRAERERGLAEKEKDGGARARAGSEVQSLQADGLGLGEQRQLLVGGQQKASTNVNATSATRGKEQGNAGVTLPSLSFDSGDEMDLDSDGTMIRLPPLQPWDDMTS
jgi:hypothetical protein